MSNDFECQAPMKIDRRSLLKYLALAGFAPALIPLFRAAGIETANASELESNLMPMNGLFRPGELTVLGGRPSMGKTALALAIARSLAVQEKSLTTFFSLEMSKKQLVQRLLCSESRVEASRIRSSLLTDVDLPKLTHAASVLSAAPIFIDDTRGLGMRDMRAKCLRLAEANPLGCIIVDYLQLMRVGGKFDVSEISKSLKALALELHVPIIAVTQLNRSVESRQNKRPVISDLPESESIEKYVDMIMLLYRDEIYHPDTAMPGRAELIIAKRRNGQIGKEKLIFRGDHLTFEHIDGERFSVSKLGGTSFTPGFDSGFTG